MAVEAKDRRHIHDVGRTELRSYSGRLLESALRTFPAELSPLVFSVTFQSIDDIRKDSVHDYLDERARYYDGAKNNGILPFSELELTWDNSSRLFLPTSGIKISGDADLTEVAKYMRDGVFRPNKITYHASFWEGFPFNLFAHRELDAVLKGPYHIELAHLDLKSHRGQGHQEETTYHNEAYVYLDHHFGIIYSEQYYVQVGTNGLNNSQKDKLYEWLSHLPISHRK